MELQGPNRGQPLQGDGGVPEQVPFKFPHQEDLAFYQVDPRALLQDRGTVAVQYLLRGGAAVLGQRGPGLRAHRLPVPPQLQLQLPRGPLLPQEERPLPQPEREGAAGSHPARRPQIPREVPREEGPLRVFILLSESGVAVVGDGWWVGRVEWFIIKSSWRCPTSPEFSSRSTTRAARATSSTTTCWPTVPPLRAVASPETRSKLIFYYIAEHVPQKLSAADDLEYQKERY